MRKVAVLLLLSLGVLTANAASAAPLGASPDTAFSATALSDGDLSSQTAMALPRTRAYAALADQYDTSYLQQVGQISRIALDNWFAQTGAELIANNLIAR